VNENRCIKQKEQSRCLIFKPMLVMIKTALSILLVSGGLAVQAQTSGNPKSTSDTTHHRYARRDWKGQDQGKGRFGQQGPRGMYANGHRRPGFGGMPPVKYTPEQRKQMTAINSDYRSRQADLYKQDNLTLGAYKAQLVSLQKDRKSKLKALITPEQQQQITDWKQRNAENQQVMEAARLERMKIRLQLSDDQAAKIKAQDLAFRSQVQSIRENDDLLPEQKRDQLSALFSRQKEALASILTPDQQAKIKSEHRPGRFGRMGGDTPGPSNN
jgi:Spy/CpxP family protein refolding chaperone